MYTQRKNITAIMTLLVAGLALFSALKGLLDSRVYEEVRQTGAISQFLVTGSLAQDIVSVPLGLILAALSLAYLRFRRDKIFVVMLGLTAYFFYGYGLYTIQGQYTSIYPVYLAIFGLSIYSLIMGLLSFNFNGQNDYQLPKAVRIGISGFLLMILLVFIPVWWMKMSADIANHLPGETYGVFILDLGIVFPALAITAVKLLQNRSVGYVLGGVGLLKVFTICLSVGFGELFQAFYGRNPLNFGMLGIFGSLTLISLGLFFSYIMKLRINPSV